MFNTNLALQKNLYILLLLPFLLHSCCTCSHSSSNELDVEKSIVSDVHSQNRLPTQQSLLKVGHPIISDTISSQILNCVCYTLSYNCKTRQPNWVMWQLKREYVMERQNGVWNEYHEDLNIEEDCRGTIADYYNSGYDRGHMCPGGDCNWNSEGRDETFLLSNMCPQNPNLNRGDWKEIEMACRKWAQKYGEVFIVCGPIFFKNQKHILIGDNRIPVPEAFFKVVLCLDKTSPKAIGFICRNTDGNRKKDFYVNSIRQVERVTGYKYFPNLSDSIRNITFDMDTVEDW